MAQFSHLHPYALTLLKYDTVIQKIKQIPNMFNVFYYRSQLTLMISGLQRRGAFELSDF